MMISSSCDTSHFIGFKKDVYISSCEMSIGKVYENCAKHEFCFLPVLLRSLSLDFPTYTCILI